MKDYRARLIRLVLRYGHSRSTHLRSWVSMRWNKCPFCGKASWLSHFYECPLAKERT